MRISILTLFPEMFQGPFDLSILKRAQEKKLLEIEIINIRDFGVGKHKIVDDKPYGGGSGMVFRVDVVHSAIEEAKKRFKGKGEEVVILTDPAGEPFKQTRAIELSKAGHLIIVCGHYEGFDNRIENFADFRLSIGDYVLTGGEIPAMVITDAVSRLIDGVIKKESSQDESFTPSEDFIEHTQFTRPENYKGLKVPRILLSGNHEEIKKYRQNESLNSRKKRLSS